MEISNLSEAEFKTQDIRMLKELSEDPSSIKKTQSEMKLTLIEIQNSLQRNNSRVDEAENQINDFEANDRKQKATTQKRKNKKEKEPKHVDRIKSLWDNFKRSNIHITGVPEGEEEEQETGNLSQKIVKENFPNLVKEIYMQVQEAQRVPNKMDAKRPTPGHSIIKGQRLKIKTFKKKKILFIYF